MRNRNDYESVAYLASVSITSLAGHLSLHDAVLPVLLDVANAIPQGWQTGPRVAIQLTEDLRKACKQLVYTVVQGQ